MFTLWTLIEASMLCLNAICILHEERFLAKGSTIHRRIPTWISHRFFSGTISVGWGSNAQVHGFGEQPTPKTQLLNLFRSIRTVAKSEFWNQKSQFKNRIFYFIIVFLSLGSSTDIPEHRGNNIQADTRITQFLNTNSFGRNWKYEVYIYICIIILIC